MMYFIRHWRLRCVIIFIFCLSGTISFALGQYKDISAKEQDSIIYIFFDIIDSDTGAKSRVQATGFIITPNGYMLTAAHAVRPWLALSSSDKANNPIVGTIRERPNFGGQGPLNLEVIDPGNAELEDIALLKLPDPVNSQAYPTAKICLRSAAINKGDEFIALGFPLNQGFQPIPGTFGLQNAAAGRWAATSAFTYGMSGGPVYSIDGLLLGIVNGGLENNTAVRWITPINHAVPYLGKANVIECCNCNSYRYYYFYVATLFVFTLAAFAARLIYASNKPSVTVSSRVPSKKFINTTAVHELHKIEISGDGNAVRICADNICNAHDDIFVSGTGSHQTITICPIHETVLKIGGSGNRVVASNSLTNVLSVTDEGEGNKFGFF